MVRRYRSKKEKEYLASLTDRDTPPLPLVEELLLSYDFDPTINGRHTDFLRLPPKAIEIFLWRDSTFGDIFVMPPLETDKYQCWPLWKSGRVRAKMDLTSHAQRDIALEMGLSPALFQDFLSCYDATFTLNFRYHYYVECRHGKNCVRPSHLVIRRSPDYEVKYPLLYRTHISHK